MDSSFVDIYAGKQCLKQRMNQLIAIASAASIVPGMDAVLRLLGIFI
jgi:hypothetical protein